MSNNIYSKIIKFKAIVGAIKKDGLNPHYKNKYATIESVLEAIEQPLKEVGLGFIQCPQETGLKTIVFCDNGETILESFVPYIGATDMQKLGSAITYARRYALVSMFGLEQEDDDGNKASGKVVQQVQQKTVVKNYTVNEVRELAKVKKIDEQKICDGYKLEKLEYATQDILNKCYQGLLKK